MDSLKKIKSEEVVKRFKEYISRMDQNELLARKVLSGLSKFDGKKITQRITPHIAEAVKPFDAYLSDSYGRFEIQIRHGKETFRPGGSMTGDLPSFTIGHRDRHNDYWPVGIIDMKKIASHFSYLDWPARKPEIEAFLPKIPALVDRWNRAMDELIELNRITENTPLASFMHTYIQE